MTKHIAPLAQQKPKSWLRKPLLSIALLATVFLMSLMFAQLGAIHSSHLPDNYFPQGVPNILGLLDSSLFMGFIVVVTIAVAVYVLYLFWQLHEVAVHRAKAMASVHTQLVFALSLCGLFLHKAWWVLAIVIAFARWDVIGNSLSRIINNGIKGEQS